MGLFYDSTYLLVILAALISMAVSARMNTIFSKYQTVRDARRRCAFCIRPASTM